MTETIPPKSRIEHCLTVIDRKADQTVDGIINGTAFALRLITRIFQLIPERTVDRTSRFIQQQRTADQINKYIHNRQRSKIKPE